MSGGGGGGGGGSSESLEQARVIGDALEGDVYWDGLHEAIFGKVSASVNQDYLRIYSDKTNHIQVIDSTKDGSGTLRPISFQVGGAQKVELAIDGGLVVGAATGGSQGLGSVNVSGNFFVNGVPFGGATDVLAWHNTGDTFGSTKKLGSLDKHDVSFVWNNVEVCHLGWEFEDTKDYYYLRFNRSTNEGQYIQCIQEQSQGADAYIAIELTNIDGGGNVVADGDLGVSGHGYSAAGAGLLPDEHFLTSNTGLYLKGPHIRFMRWTGDLTAQEVCKVSDGASVGGIADGCLEFDRNDGGTTPILMVQSDSAGYIQARFSADVATAAVGVTGSTWGGTADLLPDEAYLGSLAGSVAIVARGLTPGMVGLPVRVVSNSKVVATFLDNNTDSIILDMPGAVGRYSILQLDVRGGHATGFAAWIHFTNTDGQESFITFPESGSGEDTYAQRDGFVTVSGNTGIGARCNVNGVNNSGWLIDSNGYMTIGAARLGLYGTLPVAQQTVTGSRASGAALADLLTKLALTGIVLDGTSA